MQIRELFGFHGRVSRSTYALGRNCRCASQTQSRPLASLQTSSSTMGYFGTIFHQLEC